MSALDISKVEPADAGGYGILYRFDPTDYRWGFQYYDSLAAAEARRDWMLEAKRRAGDTTSEVFVIQAVKK